MRTSILAFAAVLMITGCGDNGTVKLDGSTNNKPDLKMNVTPPDLAVQKAVACPAVLDCLQTKTAQQCSVGEPAAALQAAQDFINCIDTSCGVPGTDAGATAPCMGDGGTTSDACNQCITNVQTGGMIQFVDQNGNPISCMPANSPDCGLCKTQVDNCFLQCFNDADCAGITSGGAPTTCQSGTCQ